MKTIKCVITQEIVDNTDYYGNENPCYADQAIINATGLSEKEVLYIRLTQVNDLPSTCDNDNFDVDLQMLDKNIQQEEDMLSGYNIPKLPIEFEITIV